MIGRFSRLGAFQGLFRYREFARCLFGGLLALAAWWLGRTGQASPEVVLGLGLASVAINGLPIILGAAKGLLDRRVNVDELVSLAIIAALAQGEVLTAATVSCIMILGTLLEETISDRARRSIKALAELAPQQAVLLTDDGAERTVPVADIHPGDRVLVRPGQRIPVDAVIETGITAVDESAITGESLPRERGPGETILAGTLNHTGRIVGRAVKMGEDSTFGKVVRLVEAAETQKPRAARLVDRYATFFTPLVLAVAGAVWALTGELDRAVAVLVAGCPCALILAAPTATVAAVGLAARRGILVKGGQYLETVAKTQAVLFDKTGTLTLGRPTVDVVTPAQGETEASVLGVAACLERDSTHPLARAILDAAHRAGLAPERADSMVTEVGLGVRGSRRGVPLEVGSPALIHNETVLPETLRHSLEAIRERGATGLVVGRGGGIIGVLGVADTVRGLAGQTIRDLRDLGIATIGIVSGDHERAVGTLARELGITDIRAGLAPKAKLDVLTRLQDEGKRVLFVGDGINDAPALAQADVGVAMGAAGSDVALETADIALTNDDLDRLPFLVRLGRRMVRRIGWNIALGLSVNTVAIIGGAEGIFSPVTAAVLHNLGSVAVVLCSASLALTGKAAPQATTLRDSHAT